METTAVDIDGRTVEVQFDVDGPVSIKAVSLIPSASEYEGPELVIEMLFGSGRPSGDYLECDVLMRDETRRIIGKFDFMEKFAAGRRCVVSHQREQFPDFAVLDIVGAFD